ncbi:MAG: hypothetical protein QW112_00910 [Candidatus Micrarchaeia archaeon]
MNKVILFAAVILGILIIVGMGYYFLFMKKPAEPAVFDDTKVTRFIRLYFGLLNVTVEDKEWKDGKWIINVSAKGAAGLERFEIRADSDLNWSSFTVLERINIPENPLTFSEMFGESCATDRGVLDIYIDPYEPWSRDAFGVIENASYGLKEFVVKRYHIVHPYTTLLEGYKYAFRTSQYLECAKKDSNAVFVDSLKCIFSKIKEKNEILNETELEVCVFPTLSSMDNKTFGMCLENESVQLLIDDGEFSLGQTGDISTKYIIIDCKYKTVPVHLDIVFCHLHPDIPTCKDVK